MSLRPQFLTLHALQNIKNLSLRKLLFIEIDTKDTLRKNTCWKIKVIHR